jgi:hypothetical protein
MKPPEQVKIRFEEAAGLAALCEELREYRVPYLLIGSNTVALDTQHFIRLQDMKLGALKDHKWRPAPATPLNMLSEKSQAEVARRRFPPAARLLETLRTRLANFR